MEEEVLEQIIMLTLGAAGFAIGQPRTEKICREWAKVLIKTLQSTDPKYTKVLIRDE